MEKNEAGGCLDGICGGDARFFMTKKVVFKDVEEKGLVKNLCLSDDSSSIGKNSDLSDNSMDKSGADDGEEVQSSYKQGALEAMEALEEVLPIRRGISRFYNGRSKSFITLSDSSSLSSIKDLAKPENAYMRRRRNLLACSLNWDKNRSCSPLRSNGGGISKRMTGSPRTTLALAVAMNCSDVDNQTGEYNPAGSLPMSSPRTNFPVWRSFSCAHLQPCASAANTCTDSNQSATETS
ncbi:hypothetical protein Salat_1800500 [Sesamum alatum]|uniref:MTD1 n=1 Tax=Sesamum alatum TaxID=300844 RepID=A0AAE1Y2A7_9LAMI|nr:hypothetical protein Salat_1800500 [Sesamum alatum]